MSEIQSNNINKVYARIYGDVPHNIGRFAGQMNHFETIKFNSTPNKNWSAQDWLLWHKLLVQAFQDGKFQSGIKYSLTVAIQNANNVFRQWWEKEANFTASNFAGYDTDFYNYFKSVGLTSILSYLQAVVTPIVGGSAKLAESGGRVIETVGKAGENVTKGISFTGKLIPIAVIAAIILVGFIVYKKAM